MMKKKLNINDVLNQVGFSEEEKIAFTECINKVKAEQEETIDNAEKEIEKIIEEVFQ